MNDSIFSSANKIKILNLETMRELDLKDKQIEIDRLTAANKRNERGFYITGIVLIGVVTTIIISRQRARLSSVRSAIAGDLHDEISSTLNSISVYSQVAKQDPEQHDQALKIIGESSRKVIDSMSDIIWTINPEHDNFEHIIDRMRSMTYNYLRPLNIEFTFRADERLNDLKISPEKRRHFFHVFKDGLNNVVASQGVTMVALTLVKEEHFVTLTIKDNGKVFDNKSAGARGMGNMHKWAIEMHGTLLVESTPGSGTIVELKFRI